MYVLQNKIVSDITTTERRSEVGIRTATRAYSLLKCQEHLWSPTSLLLSGYIGSAREIKWTGREIHLRLVPRLRMSRAIPLFPLYTVMAWMETPSPFESLCIIFCEGNKTRKTSSTAIETKLMRADNN